MRKQKLEQLDTERAETFDREPKPRGQQGPPTLLSHSPDSTLLSHATYNPEEREMIVTFRSTHSSYRYCGVPQHIWEDFCVALSAGNYFIQRIRNAGFDGTRVG